MGRFHDYEDRGMIEVLAHKLEMGELQVLCVDSVDGESWHNQAIHPRARVLRHLHYDRYISQDVIPWIRSRNSSSPLTLTGCDFGGYHAVNFSLRHPDLVTRCVSMGEFSVFIDFWMATMMITVTSTARRISCLI